jgi:hypothetical protein
MNGINKLQDHLTSTCYINHLKPSESSKQESK